MFESVAVSSKGKAEALVVGVFAGTSGVAPLDAGTKAHAQASVIERARKLPECSGAVGALGEVFTDGRAPQRVLVVGLGEKKNLTLESLRRSMTSVYKRLAAVKAASAELSLAGPLEAAKLDIEEAGRAAGEIASLMAYDSDRFKGAEARKKLNKPKLALRSTDSAFERAMKRGVAIGAGVNAARECSDTPPNIATPKWMAAQARALARKHDTVSVRVIEGAALAKERLEGLINVGKASENAPCLIRIAYTPKNAAKSAKPIVLIGKTITYDTGGLSIKPSPSMAGMKHDMGGGSAALGAMHIIASVVKPKRPVIALLPAAENSISDEAYRPDDVLTFRNGKTVEITNTDAEGRLVLADALCWACDKEKPECMIDMATLTGGVVVALGSTYAGLWSDNDALRSRIDGAAEMTGERVWRLPLHDEYTEMMKSSVADLVNSNPNRKAHPIQGAAFLQQFVDPSVPWAHIDIAGTWDVESPTGPFARGATGFGARLVARVVEDW